MTPATVGCGVATVPLYMGTLGAPYPGGDEILCSSTAQEDRAGSSSSTRTRSMLLSGPESIIFFNLFFLSLPMLPYRSVFLYFVIFVSKGERERRGHTHRSINTLLSVCLCPRVII